MKEKKKKKKKPLKYHLGKEFPKRNMRVHGLWDIRKSRAQVQEGKTKGID